MLVFSEEKCLLSHFMKIVCSSDLDIIMGWERWFSWFFGRKGFGFHFWGKLGIMWLFVVKEMWKYWATNLWNKARIINSRRIWLESCCDRICLWIDNWTSYWVFRHLKKDKLVCEKFGVHSCTWWWGQVEALILDLFTVIVIIMFICVIIQALLSVMK